MSVTVASQSPTSRRMSSTSRWPTSRSAALTPWWVYRDRPRTSMVTSVWSPPSSSKSASSSTSSGSRSSSGSWSGAIPLQRSTRDAERLMRLGDVVDPEDAGAALVGQDVRGDRAGDALVGVRRVDELVDERLAADADDDAEPERDELVGAGPQLEVVGQRLAEADAGVEVDPVLLDALAHGELGPLEQERLDLVDDVGVAGVLLHRARLAEHVHQAAARAVVGGQAGHVGGGPERG